jgi:hypothetical protein
MMRRRGVQENARLSLLFLEDSLTFIGATMGAYMMGQCGLMALGAERDVRHLDMIMRSPHVSSRSRFLLFWYGHIPSLISFYVQFLKVQKGGMPLISMTLTASLV